MELYARELYPDFNDTGWRYASQPVRYLEEARIVEEFLQTGFSRLGLKCFMLGKDSLPDDSYDIRGKVKGDQPEKIVLAIDPDGTIANYYGFYRY